MPGYDDETLIVIANLYYIEGLSQEEVAAKMGLSRVAVTRMLRRAREEGLVQITVKKPLPELFALGLRLLAALRRQPEFAWIREGAWLEVQDEAVTLAGGTARLFRRGRPAAEAAPGARVDLLLLG